MTAAPRLRTARLTLRPLQAGDRPALTALFASPAVRRHLDVEVESFEGARCFSAEFVRRALAEAGGVTTGALAIVPHGSERPAGYCGLRPLPDRLDAAELTYALAPQAWGAGYATEAGRAVLDHGFERLGLAETLAMAFAESGLFERAVNLQRQVLEQTKLGGRASEQERRVREQRLELYLRGEPVREPWSSGR